MKNTILFLGFGYSARFIVQKLDINDWCILIANTRVNAIKKQLFDNFFKNLEKNNYPINADTNAHHIAYLDGYTEKENIISDYNDIIHRNLENVTHILITAPPSNGSDPAYDIYKNIFLENKCPNLKWVGYLSATSVYGDSDGLWCNEESLTTPISERGKNRLLCENIWLDLWHSHQIPVHIFRLSGIYGPDRNNINDIIEEKAISILKENHVSNRIYVKDLAKAVVLSMNNPTPAQIFNISDDMPSPTSAVNDYIAFMLNVKEPEKLDYRQIKNNLSDMKNSFLAETKRISNQKIKDMLGMSFDFPSYREGIMDIVKHHITSNRNNKKYH